jgi:arsenate reductase (thioredoxin)
MTPEDEVRQLFARLNELAQDETLSEDDATVVVAGLLGALGSMLSNPAWQHVMARTGTPPPPRWLRRGLAWPEDADPGPPVPLSQAVVPRPREGTAMTAHPAVLVVGVHGAGRSPMAAALLDHYTAGRVVVRSAAAKPIGTIDPAVSKVMAEIGVDLSKVLPRPLTTEAVQASDLVITMGGGDVCPFYPGKHYLDWDLEDPAGKDIASVRRIRDAIDARVRGLLPGIENPPGGAPGSRRWNGRRHAGTKQVTHSSGNGGRPHR